MAMTERTWRIRIFGEIPVIVLGILIALGIEAAVKGAGARQREAEYIEGLKQEFASYRTMLEHNLEELEDMREAARQLLLLSRTTTRNVPVDSLNRLLRDANSFMVFTPGSSLLATIVESGELRTIRGTDLRVALMGWEATLANQRLPEGHALGAEELRNQLEQIPVASVYRFVPADSSERDIYERRITMRDFENHIASRLLVTDWNYATTRTTLDYVRHVSQLLGQGH